MHSMNFIEEDRNGREPGFTCVDKLRAKLKWNGWSMHSEMVFLPNIIGQLTHHLLTSPTIGMKLVSKQATGAVVISASDMRDQEDDTLLPDILIDNNQI